MSGGSFLIKNEELTDVFSLKFLSRFIKDFTAHFLRVFCCAHLLIFCRKDKVKGGRRDIGLTHRGEGHRELTQHGALPSLAGGEWSDRCDLYCEERCVPPALP
jgi:hypothetical protein